MTALRSTIALAIGLSLVGCSAASNPQRDIVAVYQGGEVTRDEYATWLEYNQKEDLPAHVARHR